MGDNLLPRRHIRRVWWVRGCLPQGRARCSCRQSRELIWLAWSGLDEVLDVVSWSWCHGPYPCPMSLPRPLPLPANPHDTTCTGCTGCTGCSKFSRWDKSLAFRWGTRASKALFVSDSSLTRGGVWGGVLGMAWAMQCLAATHRMQV